MSETTVAEMRGPGKFEHPLYEEFAMFLGQNLPMSLFKTCVSSVLADQRFQEAPASTKKHHVWRGGLMAHTYEVCLAAKAICDLNHARGKRIDRDVVLVACVFHDYAKIHDYGQEKQRREMTSEDGMISYGTTIEETVYVKTEHFHKIHHVVASYEHFRRNYVWPGETEDKFAREVGHCILAHHGRLEWGSPVEPQTQEAWAVHLADMTSVQCIEVRKPEEKK